MELKYCREFILLTDFVKFSFNTLVRGLLSATCTKMDGRGLGDLDLCVASLNSKAVHKDYTYFLFNNMLHYCRLCKQYLGPHIYYDPQSGMCNNFGPGLYVSMCVRQ